MASWWKRLRGRLGKAGDEPAAMQQRAVWRPPSQTGFDVEVLDLIAVTGTMLSTTQDPDFAARAASWSSAEVSALNDSGLHGCAEVVCDLTLPADPLLGDGFLFTPREMEQKWVLALRGDSLLAVRSWTGEVKARAHVRRSPQHVHIDRVAFADDAGFDAFGDRLQTFEWLLRTHALGQSLPLPVDDEGAALLENVPLSVFPSFGNMARCAARTWSPPAPQRPLRADGPVMHAVRTDDEAALARAVEAGESVDAPSPTQGFRPLHLAAIRNDRPWLRRLLDRGADPDATDDRGLAAIGFLIVHGGDLESIALLESRGAHLDLVNEDGFGFLHAAAETDRGELVPWLVEHGVDREARTRHGHTPLQIACALGHLDAARALLEAGADPKAQTDGATARDIAEREGRPEAVALLDRFARDA